MAKMAQAWQKDIDSMDTMTPRIKALLQSYYDSGVVICAKRSHLATESWKETEGQPIDLRRAKLFAKICDEIPIAIFDNELIVGSQTSFVRGVGLQLDFNPKTGFEITEGDIGFEKVGSNLVQYLLAELFIGRRKVAVGPADRSRHKHIADRGNCQRLLCH